MPWSGSVYRVKSEAVAAAGNAVELTAAVSPRPAVITMAAVAARADFGSLRDNMRRPFVVACPGSARSAVPWLSGSLPTFQWCVRNSPEQVPLGEHLVTICLCGPGVPRRYTQGPRR